ncbi:DUF4440 domain-containing protein [Ekhidna sp.]|uniref:YybH family protein n=1 Tax=Ekhidna sp. TaxID=2608089 RepID=UPI003299FB3C
MKNLTTLLIVLVFVVGCQQTGPPMLTDADIADIATRRDIIVTMVKTADFSPAADVYDPNCIVLPPGMDATKGIEATTNSMSLSPPAVDFSITNNTIEGNGTYAFATGTYKFSFMVNDSTQMDDIGKYIEVWKKQEDGTWRLYQDIWNSSVSMN